MSQITEPKDLQSIGLDEKPAETFWRPPTGHDKCCKCGGVAQETVAGGMWRCTFIDCGYFMTDETINTGPKERPPYVPSIAELERAVIEAAVKQREVDLEFYRNSKISSAPPYNALTVAVDALLKARGTK